LSPGRAHAALPLNVDGAAVAAACAVAVAAAAAAAAAYIACRVPSLSGRDVHELYRALRGTQGDDPLEDELLWCAVRWTQLASDRTLGLF
jgi:hypothetical protein